MPTDFSTAGGTVGAATVVAVTFVAAGAVTLASLLTKRKLVVPGDATIKTVAAAAVSASAMMVAPVLVATMTQFGVALVWFVRNTV